MQFSATNICRFAATVTTNVFRVSKRRRHLSMANGTGLCSHAQNYFYTCYDYNLNLIETTAQ
ncbi:hypothetical protein [Coleofasciculus sp. FACHB-1120]|uniref:hypothetical protein n=1 Tax=Coleofasciculus sp. FACHB-1120 TaxID=2692783 RepID=UPI0016868A97|nr:hypothetical protein [Coleofasciculus sp. FACHB-1120]MBD2740904.1 hypothetical protein [Coleofasciculus sp. FACHB-1120]